MIYNFTHVFITTRATVILIENAFHDCSKRAGEYYSCYFAVNFDAPLAKRQLRIHTMC